MRIKDELLQFQFGIPKIAGNVGPEEVLSKKTGREDIFATSVSSSRQGEHMGMDADLLAIGKFTKELLYQNTLEYDDYYYEHTKEGTIIIVTVVNCATTDESTNLAEALKIGPWNFNEHHITNDYIKQNIDWKNLRKYYNNDESEDHEIIKRLKMLIDAGFEFFYRPNG